MYAIDFEYAEEMLSDYGMMIGSFDGSQDGTVQSGADIKFNQVKPSGSNKSLIVSTSYEECYSTTFQIIKNPCTISETEEMFLSPTEVSQLQRWLCRKNYNRFRIMQDNFYDLYWNSVFSSKQVMYGGKIVGLELTMYTDHPYGFNDELEVEYDCSTNNQFTIYNLSDETGVLYPEIEITLLESPSNDFELYNYTESVSRKTKISGCSSGEIIKFSGDTKIISTSYSSHTTMAKDFNYIFPRIINYYEERENIIKVNASCKIKIRYSPIKKVGL